MDILFAILIVTGVGLIAGFGLSIASVLMAVPTDDTVEKVRACLPGANCGACGYTGCDSYAEALAAGECAPNLCAPGGAATAAALAEVLGVEVEAKAPQRAVVLCNGTCENTGAKMDYKGMQSCAAANMMYGGVGDCRFGCLGFGDCAVACPFGAISVQNGKAVVDEALCTACGACAKACPKGIISILPAAQAYMVLCSNKDKGPVAKKACKVASIGWGLCAKKCPSGAITVENFLAKIDPEKCTGCGACAEACVQKCISLN